MKKLHIIAAGAAFAGTLGAITLVAPGPGPDRSLPQMNVSAADASLVEDITIGSVDAPVEVIEYASFTCPHCADFSENGYPRLVEDFVDTGLVRYTHREVYFDRFGLWAGLVARCGGGERYHPISGEIYAKQGKWTRGSDGAEVADSLRRIGLASGLTAEALDACLSDRAMAEALVADYEANAAEHGIASTPSFVINGKTYTNRPYGQLKALIEAEIAD